MDKTFTIDLTGTDEEVDARIEAMIAEMQEEYGDELEDGTRITLSFS